VAGTDAAFGCQKQWLARPNGKIATNPQRKQ
jgi:hypothetical protein